MDELMNGQIENVIGSIDKGTLNKPNYYWITWLNKGHTMYVKYDNVSLNDMYV